MTAVVLRPFARSFANRLPWNYGICKSTSSLAQLRDVAGSNLDSIRTGNRWKKPEPVITSPQGATIRLEGQSREVLNFCANNYLGLSSHPEVIAAAHKGLEEYGAGLSSVRFICGTQKLHKDLERKIAAFHGKDDAILYPSCFDANAGLFEALLKPLDKNALACEDATFSDKNNHASIIDGIHLCKKLEMEYRYEHLDMVQLESQLKEASDARMKLIVSDGVFSMDGEIAPLKCIHQLAEEYGALIFLDECHATGILGETGRGTEEYFEMLGSVDIINSTLGKALGGAAGGYTTGPQELIDLLRQSSRPYSFSNSLPPQVVASASKALDLVKECSDLKKTLIENAIHFRKKMKAAGFTVKGYEEHPIVPVMLAGGLVDTFADEMMEKGIYVVAFKKPVVPEGAERIRVQLSAAHSKENVDKCLEAFVEVGKKLKVIP